MKHFASDYEIDEAVARYEGLPYVAKSCNCWDGYERVPGTKPCAPGSCRKCDEGCHKKSSEITSQPFVNPVPLATEPGYTAGGGPIDETLESAPSAVGTGKEASAHKVEKDDDKFYVTEKGEGNVAGPFDTQEEAYSRANELNDLENLEKESGILDTIVDAADTALGVVNPAYKFISDGVDKIIPGGLINPIENTVKNVTDIAPYTWEYNDWVPTGERTPEWYEKNSAQGDKPSPDAAKAVLEALSSGDESGALDLLGETDCPQGCDTHPEGKCNHGYMAAGRTRIRYLVDNQAFKNHDDDPKEFGTTHYDSPDERG